MKEKPGFWGGLIVGLLMALSILFLILFGESIHNMLLGRGFNSGNSAILTSEVKQKIDLINDYIDYYYLDYQDDDVSGETPEERAEGMYKGLVDSLNDKYSEYYSPKEYSRVHETQKGSFEGIGVTIVENDQGLFEVAGFTSDDSSAKASGVQEGDIFYQVDGQDAVGIDISALVDMVRGREGTSVNIIFLRGEYMDKVELTIPRKKVETKTVSYNMLENKVGHIMIGSFEEITVEQFESALSDLKEQGMEKLILDLRGNGGGMVDVAVKITDDLIGTGVVTYTLDKQGERKDYNAVTPVELGLPMVVLVDSGSASASELVTGALKDHGAAKVVGTTTYGKGIVQNLYPLTDGSAIKLTNARYYTPSGVNIQGTGIEPDVVIEFDPEAYKKNGRDNQLEKAKELLK